MGTLPVLPVHDVAASIDHYVSTFGFEEILRVPGENGALSSGRVSRGDNEIMFNLNPGSADKGGGGIWIWLRMDGEDIDGLYNQVKARDDVTIIEDIGDRFWGDRSFAVRDALGYTLAFNARLDG